jgi:hypothetical protein
MINIRKLIPSKSLRLYLKEIEHEFTLCEEAALVYKNPFLRQDERLDALNEIARFLRLPENCSLQFPTYRNCIDVSPDSGEKIIGFEIPNWSEVLNTVKRCALMVPELRYIGWDVAIGVNGIPLLIEGNSNSGVDVFQVSLQKGVRDIVNKGLEGKS